MESRKITDIDILELRVEGFSFVEIAQKFGCTKQCIDNHLRKLCPNKADINHEDLHIPALNEDTIHMLLPLIVKYKGDADSISRQTGIERQEVQNLIYFLCAKRRSWSEVENYYPSLNRWCKQNLFTRAELAEKIGISASNLNRILHGQAHMSAKNAVKIQRVTGLSIREIFDCHVPPETLSTAS